MSQMGHTLAAVQTAVVAAVVVAGRKAAVVVEHGSAERVELVLVMGQYSCHLPSSTIHHPPSYPFSLTCAVLC
jgi:hypothetical protein